MPHDQLQAKPSGEFADVIVFDHPLIQHKLTYLRDASTSHRPFRALLYQIAGLMVYEVTRNYPTESISVQTPMERTGGVRLAGTVTDRTGAPMVFAVLADRIALVDTLDARAALDDLTSALAACRCGAAGTVAP